MKSAYQQFAEKLEDLRDEVGYIEGALTGLDAMLAGVERAAYGAGYEAGERDAVKRCGCAQSHDPGVGEHD